MKIRILALVVFVSICLSLQALPRVKFVTITVDKPVEYSYLDSATNDKSVYWVITARLENKTGRDRNVALSVKLKSDYKRLDQEYELIPCSSFKPIQEMKEFDDDKTYFDYIDMSKKTFKRNEVRDVIFMFRRPSRYSNNLTLLVEGLSDVKIQKIKASPTNDDVLSLHKCANDFFAIGKPRMLKLTTREGVKTEERRIESLEEKDFEGLEGKPKKTYLIYRRKFIREGDEFQVHEDDILKKKNELNNWILIVADVLPGFNESE